MSKHLSFLDRKISILAPSVKKLFKKISPCFEMCIGVLPTGMTVHHMHKVWMGARRGHQVPWNYSHRQLLIIM
jgi:hypothetical protein